MSDFEIDWVNEEIAREVIRERLGVTASEENVKMLAKLITDFELDVTKQTGKKLSVWNNFAPWMLATTNNLIFGNGIVMEYS